MLGLLTFTCSVVCLLPQAYSNKLRLAALDVPGFISLWCLGAQRKGMVINMKYKYGNRHFWCRGYYVSTVGKNRRAIEQYIRNQLQEDYTDDQMSIKEYVDPFTGEPVKGGK